MSVMPAVVSGRHIVIAGLGSIGRRHLSNLQALGWHDIRLFRTGQATGAGADLATFPVDHDLRAALDRRPLAVIVCNPTSLHLPVAREAVRAGAHLLIEKPLSHDLEGVTELEHAVERAGLTALVGFHFRFDPGLGRIKQWIDTGAIGVPVSAQVHWGEYLPDMHPWENYRVGYAARSSLGGGVLLTLCHPFDYLTWLLGPIQGVAAVESRLGVLDVDVETCTDVTLRFVSGASGHVHLNFLERPPEHALTIVGTEGTISWNARDHAARRYSPYDARWDVASAPAGFERNTTYVNEMRHFLECLSGAASPACTLRDARSSLEVVLAAKRALGLTSPQQVA